MGFRVEWTPPARRDLSRLPPRAALAVLTFVDSRLAENPERLSEPLRGELAELRSARNGDYRILFRFDKDPPVRWIVGVEHRAHAYRPR